MSNNPSPLVSIIIPVYKAERYLQECLDSIYSQTISSYEIILVNDGSPDASNKVISKNILSGKRLTVINQENSGQGVARNKALRIAKGKYVLFLDADDMLEPRTLELSINRANKDKSDFVHFGWKFYSHRSGKYKYTQNEAYFGKEILKDGECDELMQMRNYFSVTSLYRKSFLDKYKIRYGEGYIYEDFEFVVAAANNAKTISIISSPLYIVRPHGQSTTKTGYMDDKHYVGFMQATLKSLSIFKPRTRYSSYYLSKYLTKKFMSYYFIRVPSNLKRKFLKEFIDAISSLDITVPSHTNDKLFKLCIKRGVFKEKKYAEFRILVAYMNRLRLKRKQLKSRLKAFRGNTKQARSSHYIKELLKPVENNTILFLGFDYRYTGNSRYLFDQIIKDKRFNDYSIKFASKDLRIPDNYRLQPNSSEFYTAIATYSTVVAESWIPSYIAKRHKATWIQLWHGTPLKKMLFDSSESEIVKLNKDHKRNKYKDIMRWDYLVSDSRSATEKFTSAFLLSKENILHSGYPRVKFLIDNNKNNKLKSRIIKSLDIKDTKTIKDKKIVFYAPTWRDYNYGKDAKHHDYKYMIDLKELSHKLGDKYLILYKDHHYLSEMPSNSLPDNCINVGEYESQEMLLISDHLVTDFSSILFDALPINLPTTLYVNDFHEYQKSRGVYEDMWDDLHSIVRNDVESVARNIKKYENTNDIKDLSKRYGYSEEINLIDAIKILT